VSRLNVVFVTVVLCVSFGFALTLTAPHRVALAQAPPRADLATFRDRVQPIFLDKRPGLARCYVCHSQGTPFRLQRLGEGRSSWNEEETLKNFEAIQRLVVAGKPEASRLLLMPLAHDAGGTEFHPGGKRWTSQNDPEWKELAQWIKAAAR
jgi:hypothetical protein